jgi:hypothetical protein
MTRQTNTAIPQKSKKTKTAPKSRKHQREPPNDRAPPTKKRRLLQVGSSEESDQPARSSARRQKTPAKKRRLLLLESSEEPDQPAGPSAQRPKTPAYFQPGSERPELHQPVEIDDSSDEDEDEENPQKRSQRSEFKGVAKTFGLKIWPWTPPEWWMGETRVEVPRTLDVTEKINSVKPQLNAIMRRDFVTFVGIDKMMSREEWMSDAFQSAVIISRPRDFIEC